jgi:predicted nuclease of restriction endonuclease-like (RecB) superfamily
LSWSHYFEILRSDNELEISFYAKQAEKENWSVRELKTPDEKYAVSSFGIEQG